MSDNAKQYGETEPSNLQGVSLMLPNGNTLLLPRYISGLLEKLEKSGYEAYVVGGCVRDAMLRRSPHDYDICTNAAAEDVKQVFSEYRVLDTGIAHGTVTVLSEGNPVEITTYRIDGDYKDHRRPDSVTFTDDISKDLARRDFTVNAMAVSLSLGFAEAKGGAEDIESGTIRCVGEPDIRFEEDALRILRAMRFAASLGFKIEDNTVAAMKRHKNELVYVSAERIYSELTGLLTVTDGAALTGVLEMCKDIMAVIIPELKPCFGFDQKTPHHCYDVWTHTLKAIEVSRNDLYLRLALLMHDIEKPSCMTVGANGKGHFINHDLLGARCAGKILRRLRAPYEVIQNVCFLIEKHDLRLEASRKNAGKLLRECGESRAKLLLNMMRCDIAAQSDYLREEKIRNNLELQRYLEQYIEEGRCYSLKDLAVDGDDLIKIGLRPGKEMGGILKRLLDKVICGDVENNRDALLKEAAGLAAALKK